MIKFKSLICILGLTVSLPVVAGPVLVAKKDGVKVFAEPKNSGAPIVTLKTGESLECIERQGMFWKVVAKGGKNGFVSFMDVTRQAGDDSNSSLSTAIRGAAQNSRDMDNVKTTRSRSAVMGVRGLDESNETAFAGSVRPNLRLVYTMEDRMVGQNDVNRLAELVQKEISTQMERKGYAP